jgi:hypothetical protein
MGRMGDTRSRFLRLPAAVAHVALPTEQARFRPLDVRRCKRRRDADLIFGMSGLGVRPCGSPSSRVEGCWRLRAAH